MRSITKYTVLLLMCALAVSGVISIKFCNYQAPGDASIEWKKIALRLACKPEGETPRYVVIGSKQYKMMECDQSDGLWRGKSIDGNSEEWEYPLGRIPSRELTFKCAKYEKNICYYKVPNGQEVWHNSINGIIELQCPKEYTQILAVGSTLYNTLKCNPSNGKWSGEPIEQKGEIHISKDNEDLTVSCVNHPKLGVCKIEDKSNVPFDEVQVDRIDATVTLACPMGKIPMIESTRYKQVKCDPKKGNWMGLPVGQQKEINIAHSVLPVSCVESLDWVCKIQVPSNVKSYFNNGFIELQCPKNTQNLKVSSTRYQSVKCYPSGVWMGVPIGQYYAIKVAYSGDSFELAVSCDEAERGICSFDDPSGQVTSGRVSVNDVTIYQLHCTRKTQDLTIGSTRYASVECSRGSWRGVPFGGFEGVITDDQTLLIVPCVEYATMPSDPPTPILPPFASPHPKPCNIIGGVSADKVDIVQHGSELSELSCKPVGSSSRIIRVGSMSFHKLKCADSGWKGSPIGEGSDLVSVADGYSVLTMSCVEYSGVVPTRIPSQTTTIMSLTRLPHITSTPSAQGTTTTIFSNITTIVMEPTESPPIASTPPSEAPAEKAEAQSSSAVVIGVVIGIILLAIVIIAVIFVMRSKNKRSDKNVSEADIRTEEMNNTDRKGDENEDTVPSEL